jgi:hypothetical protein
MKDGLRRRNDVEELKDSFLELDGPVKKKKEVG